MWTVEVRSGPLTKSTFPTFAVWIVYATTRSMCSNIFRGMKLNIQPLHTEPSECRYHGFICMRSIPDMAHLALIWVEGCGLRPLLSSCRRDRESAHGTMVQTFTGCCCTTSLNCGAWWWWCGCWWLWCYGWFGLSTTLCEGVPRRIWHGLAPVPGGDNIHPGVCMSAADFFSPTVLVL